MLFRQRFCQSNNLFLICSLLLAAGFLVQIKVLYNSHQKNLRIQEYQHRLKDVRESIMSVERLANYTSVLMDKLENATRKSHKLRKIKYKIS